MGGGVQRAVASRRCAPWGFSRTIFPMGYRWGPGTLSPPQPRTQEQRTAPACSPVDAARACELQHALEDLAQERSRGSRYSDG